LGLSDHDSRSFPLGDGFFHFSELFLSHIFYFLLVLLLNLGSFLALSYFLLGYFGRVGESLFPEVFSSFKFDNVFRMLLRVLELIFFTYY
jgi:hypothetical protein